MVEDPICGMYVEKKEAEKKGLVSKKSDKKYYFCSKGCLEKFQGKTPFYQTEKFAKAFPYFLGAILIIGTALSMIFNFMLTYMGAFFIVFSLAKMVDWKGFVNAFSEYDLIAKTTRAYAWIYPALEFALGILFLLNLHTNIVASITLAIMSIGGLGVSIKLSKKEKFQCACLGTKLNVPLTKVTLLENTLMVVMSLIILIQTNL